MLTYEDLYPAEYAPGEHRGGLPEDPRPLRPLTVFVVRYSQKTVKIHRGGILLGPTPILWDVLEFHPVTSNPELVDGGQFWIHEVVGDQSTEIFRWHEKRGAWRRIATGEAAG